jgi:hypothetical protein
MGAPARMDSVLADDATACNQGENAQSLRVATMSCDQKIKQLQ